MHNYSSFSGEHVNPYSSILNPPIEYEGRRLLITKQISRILGVSNSAVQDTKKRNSMYLKEGVHYFIFSGDSLRMLRESSPKWVEPRARKLTAYTLEGFEVLLAHSRDGNRRSLPYMIDYFKQKPKKYKIIKPVSKEGLFGEKLEKAFKGVSYIEKQVAIDEYRIDFFFPSLNLAVEFDEEYHNSPEQRSKDRERDSSLKERYGITTIRISEKDSFPPAINKVLLAIARLKGSLA